jgi:hypothetical protein
MEKLKAVAPQFREVAEETKARKARRHQARL